MNMNIHAERTFIVIPAQAGIQNLQDFFPQIAPFWVAFFNQLKLPGTIPFFELLFSGDGRGHVTVHFIVHQAMNSIFFGKAFHQAVPVLPAASNKVARYPNVESPIALAGENVDTRLFFHDAILDSCFRGNDNYSFRLV
jgi:hypothetical protein